MDVRSFVQSVEAAQQQFLPCLAVEQEPTLRQQLRTELQQMEVARIAEGQEARAARNGSCQRVKMLHGLGYPVDFDWLHGPIPGLIAKR